MASINFTEVTSSAGLTSSGESFGASWGDLNNDNFLDLWVTNHGRPSTLYSNNGNGQFTNVTGQVEGAGGDSHGTAWADFDNDGDQDLIEVVGGAFGVGTGPSNFYINNNGTLQNQAEARNLDYPLGRSRSPLWLDYNNDGRLDLVVAAVLRPDGQAPSTLFRQNDDGTFSEAKEETGFSFSGGTFAILADVTGDDSPEIIGGGGFAGQKVFDTSTTPFRDVTNSIPFGDTKANDIAAADFNGDLKQDLYVVDGSGGTDINQSDNNTVEGYINVRQKEEGLQFNSSGSITFNLSTADLPGGNVPTEQIFIGATGFNPNSDTFTLSPEDANVTGILNHTAGEDRGIYIGYNENTQSWQVLASGSDTLQLSAIINSTESITGLDSVGFDDSATPAPDKLLLSGDQGLQDRTSGSGINSIPTNGGSVVTGDFDNDRDVDVYVVSTKTAQNQPNVLYENQGDGTFTAVENAGGAAGSNQGLGDSVITADYDNDGFLDVFLTNGEDPKPFNKDGPVELFRNQGNGNHWLQIDLEGTVSNEDGIGAKVFVTSGGVTQVREQSGGVHRHSQNQQRIHFGLGDSTQVDEITIQWPSGIEQKIENVDSDQIIDITESSTGEPSTEPESPTNGELTAADFEGQPSVDLIQDSGLFLWKDNNDVWTLQAVAGGNAQRFVGSISADVQPDFVETDKVEGNDIVNTSNPNQINFELDVIGFGEDLVQFKFADTANISLDLENGADPLRIGDDSLAVDNVPIELIV